jgi:hypothetical protein
MNNARIYLAILCLALCFVQGCSTGFYHYTPNEGLPRMMFIDEQVSQRWMKVQELPQGTFVQIITQEGESESGLLKTVSDQHLLMSGAFRVAKGGEPTDVQTVEIPRQQIMVLKVW